MTKRTCFAIVAALAISSAALADPLTTKSGVLPTPVDGQGQVVFYRPGSMMGVALGCTVHEGEPQIARLGSGKYFVVPATPGKHEYSVRGDSTDRLTVEVEAGETYFVRCNIGMSMLAGGANLSPSDEASFAKKAKGLALWSGPKVTEAPTAK